MKHIYENKGVRLYYELPDDYAEVVQQCRMLGVTVEHWQDARKVLIPLVQNMLNDFNITTVPHDGGWGH